MLKLNLQLFAEGGDAGLAGGETAPAQAATDGAPAKVNPLLSDDAWGAPAQPTPEQQAFSKEFDFGGRKIAVNDPAMAEALNGLYGDYSELTRTYQTVNQQNQFYQQMMAQQMQAQQAQAAPQQPVVPEPTPEDLQAQSEQFMEKWYENPLQALQEMLTPLIEQKVKPIAEPITQMQREQRVASELRDLNAKYGDVQNLVPQMQQVLAENPQLEGMGLETVYAIAKGRSVTSLPSPQDLLQDPTVRQMVLGDQTLQQEFQRQYLQRVQQSQQQAPQIMGGSAGSQAPSMPQGKPKTIAEASAAFLNQWK